MPMDSSRLQKFTVPDLMPFDLNAIAWQGFDTAGLFPSGSDKAPTQYQLGTTVKPAAAPPDVTDLRVLRP